MCVCVCVYFGVLFRVKLHVGGVCLRNVCVCVCVFG